MMMTMIKILFLLILIINSIKSDLYFDLKLINVDSQSALFELIDDNKTTLNYKIDYSIINKQSINNNHITSDSITSKKQLILQTNPMFLLEKQLQISNFPEADDDLSGENYNSAEIIQIKSKTYKDIHQFYVHDLEPNKFYSINFLIKARKAHLSLKLIPNQEIDKTEYEKKFSFDFKTSFDLATTALLACNRSLDWNSDLDIEALSSCYVINSNCSKCKPTCYEISTVPTLCEPCPCDVFRSSGECEKVVTQSSANYQTYLLKCKKCLKPYTGFLCNECENEGIDYYKNELGECVKCDCNNNSGYDLNKIGKKCQSITGNCIECLYNTSGKHCHECKEGYHGDALKGTCQLSKIFTNRTTTQTINNNFITKLNQKYSFKTLALFSLYIFLVLILILSVILCIKRKYINNSNVLKNESSGLCSQLNNVATRLNESTRHYRNRLRFFISSLSPRNVNLNPSGSNLSNGIYNRANNNDDDRLNLAEYQVFDDSLLVTDSSDNNRFNDFNNENKNPYRSLTIKS